MDTFYALAEPNRRTIVEMLARQGRLSASAISKDFRISTSAISQHLKILREANVILMEKRAQQRIYQLNPEAILEIENWSKRTTELWNNRFDRLDRLLEVEKLKKNVVKNDRKQ